MLILYERKSPNQKLFHDFLVILFDNFFPLPGIKISFSLFWTFFISFLFQQEGMKFFWNSGFEVNITEEILTNSRTLATLFPYPQYSSYVMFSKRRKKPLKFADHKKHILAFIPVSVSRSIYIENSSERERVGERLLITERWTGCEKRE